MNLFTEKLVETLIMAEEGDTILLGPGRWNIADGLVLDADGVTIRGAGAEETVLSFKGQTGSGEGLLVTSDGVVLEDFAVEDTKGDGIKSKGSDRITFRNLRVEWTNGPDEKNGAYGVYPVSSTNVLIEGVTVRGASDAGIYVGQSQDIIVRNNLAEYNVAGIEVENSIGADVYNNTAIANTGGILVFNMPGIPKRGYGTRVFDNDIKDNNTANFAAPAQDARWQLSTDDVTLYKQMFASADSGKAGKVSAAGSLRSLVCPHDTNFLLRKVSILHPKARLLL